MDYVTKNKGDSVDKPEEVCVQEVNVDRPTEGENNSVESNSLPTPPDGGWGWVVVFGSFMIHLVTDGVTYSFGVLYNKFLNDFNEGKSKTSWILSTLVGVTLCSGPISSALVNKYGCKSVTIAGSIVAGISLFISRFANSVAYLIVTIGFFTGFGFGLIYVPAIVSVSVYFEKNRSLATGIAVCGSGFGTFVFSPIINLALQYLDWRDTITFISVAVLKCSLYGFLFRQLSYDSAAVQTENEDLPQLTETEALVEKEIRGSSALDLHNAKNDTKEINKRLSVSHFSLSRLASQVNSARNIPALSNNNIVRMDRSNGRMAVSQPMLASQTDHQSSIAARSIGPMDRPDIFYPGSLTSIPSCRSRIDLKARGDSISGINHQWSSTLGKTKSTNKENDLEMQTNRGQCCGIEMEALKRTLRDMLNFSILTDGVFILFAASNFLTSIGFNIPYLFLVPRATSLQLSDNQGSTILAIMGIGNTIGRVVLGYLSDKSWVNRLQVYIWSLTICGIATILSVFCTDFIWLSVYASIFGSTIGVYVGLTSVILVDLLGLEKLTNSFGLLLLFQGFASLIGPPLGGALYDFTSSYEWTFYLSGSSIALSGLMLYFLLCFKKTDEQIGVAVNT